MVQSDNSNDVQLKPNGAPVGDVPNKKGVGLDPSRKRGPCYNCNTDIHVGTNSFDLQDPQKKSGASSARPHQY